MSKHKNTVKKKLSIIIPFYGQNESDLAIPLRSINNQVSVDFAKIDVHLVNDGGKPINTDNLAIFANLDLHYHELHENVGPGMARQYGIDHSAGEYLMFVDADDYLNHSAALSSFFSATESDENAQVLRSKFIEQVPNGNGDLIEIIAGYDRNAVYACWIARKWLNKIKLRFISELRIYEDSYFIDLINNLTPGIKSIDDITYVYVFHEKSLSHVGKSVSSEFADTWVLSKYYELKFLSSRKSVPFLKDYLAAVLLQAYLRYEKFPPVDEEKFWSVLWKLMKKYAYLWEGFFAEMQLVANQESQMKNGEFYGIDTSNLRKFIKKCER